MDIYTGNLRRLRESAEILCRSAETLRYPEYSQADDRHWYTTSRLITENSLRILDLQSEWARLQHHVDIPLGGIADLWRRSLGRYILQDYALKESRYLGHQTRGGRRSHSQTRAGRRH